MRNALFLLCYLVFVTSANVFLKLSADANGVWLFIAMQAAGNLAGFVGILAYTGLMRTLPLHIAFPLTRGFVVLGVQLVGGMIVLKEKISPLAWVGTGLILSGIVLFSI